MAGAFSTGSSSMDSLLGQGAVPGSTLLLGGEPGVGKSTFLLQLMGALQRSGRKGVYVSGEESLPQLRKRAERLKVLETGITALNTTSLEDVLDVIRNVSPHLLVVDSIQTLVSAEVEGISGSVSQVRAVASSLLEAVKQRDCVLILVGHVTKEGHIAGPKLLEHMVDTVLSLEGDRQHAFRILRVIKNRFGPTSNMLVLSMVEQGLQIVRDPSTFFLQARDPSLSGTGVVMALEGQRAFAIEVQALAGRSFLAMPRRTALGFDTNRMHVLLAILEKKLGLNLSQVDVYAKIGAGLKLEEPSLDLGIVAAVLSSYFNRPLPEKSVFWGEVDLSGQIRPVNGHGQRLQQARQLRFRPIFCPAGNCSAEQEPPPSDITPVDTVAGLQELLFGS
jgi:DNA repair protein RadA/Sms